MEYNDYSVQLQGQLQRRNNIEIAINAWLKSKSKEREESRTKETYDSYLSSFRSILSVSGLDLDGLPIDREATEEEKENALPLLAYTADKWASMTQKVNSVSASTYNQRLSTLSSFYIFAKKRGFIKMENPIGLLERRKTQEYASAQPLSKEEVIRVIGSIDKQTLAGKRDRALLLVFISTGRRASEVLGLQWKHVQIEGSRITLHFEHCKGGVKMRDELEPRVANALQEYRLSLLKQGQNFLDPECFVWISLSLNHFMKPLTQRGLGDIFKKHLGTMKVHTTRHTFAHNMAKTGASVMDIQARLGHSNVATTGRYLQQLDSAENKHVSKLLDYLGIEE